MKKLMTMILLACGTVAMAQGSKTILPRSLRAVPQAFTVDGKAIPYLYLYSYDDDSESEYCKILDEDLQEVKTINLKEATCNWYNDIEERAETSTVDYEYYNEFAISQYDGSTTFTEEEALSYLVDAFHYSKDELIVDKHNPGYVFFYNKYDYEVINGEIYARTYWYINTENKFFRVDCYYRVERSFKGEWTTRKEEGVDNEGIISIYLNDWRSSYADGESFRLSQTLFNDDAAFEYMLPLMEIQKGELEEIDRDGDGEIDYKQTSYSPQTVGFSIVSETGTVLQSIRFDEGFTSWSDLNADIYLMGDKCYLVFEGSLKNWNDACLVYSLDRTSNSIQKVAMHVGPKVSPTVADRSETITVELGETNAREIQVVNAAGKTTLRVPVRNGQKQVSFSARNLSRGINVVNVVGDKNSNQTKVIVK